MVTILCWLWSQTGWLASWRPWWSGSESIAKDLKVIEIGTERDWKRTSTSNIAVNQTTCQWISEMNMILSPEASLINMNWEFEHEDDSKFVNMISDSWFWLAVTLQHVAVLGIDSVLGRWASRKVNAGWPESLERFWEEIQISALVTHQHQHEVHLTLNNLAASIIANLKLFSSSWNQQVALTS